MQQPFRKVSQNAVLQRQSSKIGMETIAGPVQLLKCAKMIPVINPAKGMTTIPIPAVGNCLPCFLTMHIESSPTNALDRLLMFNLCTTYCEPLIDISTKVDVKLPSVGLVDTESATQFARNIVDMMQLQCIIGADKSIQYSLVVK